MLPYFLPLQLWLSFFSFELQLLQHFNCAGERRILDTGYFTASLISTYPPQHTGTANLLYEDKVFGFIN